MRILIDEKPSDPLTPAQWREISLWTMKDSFQGSMLTADEATRAYISKTKWVYIVVSPWAAVWRSCSTLPSSR